MTGRERQLAALNRKPTDRVSIDCICVENEAEVASYLHVDPEQVKDRLGIDGRIVAAGDYLGETEEGKDEWGTTAGDDYSLWHSYPLAGGLAGYRPPDPDRYDYAKAARRAAAYQGAYAIRGPYWNPLFSRLCSLYGMEEALVRMVTEPREFEQATEMVFEYLYRYCENLLQAMGDHLDILCLADDFASQKGMLFSPELWRRYFKNRWKEIFALGKRYGKKIWFHSCGDITAVLGDLIDIGADVWETVQLHTLPFSAQFLKREYGKDILFFGGINTQALPFWTTEEVCAEVRRVAGILYADGEGLILGPDHHIKYDISPETTWALFRTAQECSFLYKKDKKSALQEEGM